MLKCQLNAWGGKARYKHYFIVVRVCISRKLMWTLGKVIYTEAVMRALIQDYSYIQKKKRNLLEAYRWMFINWEIFLGHNNRDASELKKGQKFPNNWAIYVIYILCLHILQTEHILYLLSIDPYVLLILVACAI